MFLRDCYHFVTSGMAHGSILRWSFMLENLETEKLSRIFSVFKAIRLIIKYLNNLWWETAQSAIDISGFISIPKQIASPK